MRGPPGAKPENAIRFLSLSFSLSLSLSLYLSPDTLLIHKNSGNDHENPFLKWIKIIISKSHFGAQSGSFRIFKKPETMKASHQCILGVAVYVVQAKYSLDMFCS